ncbi:MAG: hypothetical protein RLZZ400_851 [Actinomycetota bacterium]
MTPVPYPKNTGAYPTAKPAPIPASTVTSPASSETLSAAENVQETAAPAAPQSNESKFFPLVPTSSSIYVAPSDPSDLEASSEVVITPIAETAPSEEVVPEQFEISSSLTPEPQTSSIVLTEVPDALLAGEIVTDTGEVLVTGSIELPAITGEMAIVSESIEADRADETDSSSLNLTNVAPVRAPAVMNSKAGVGTIPNKHRRTSGQLMAMLTLGLLIITVGSLYIMAAALGVV